MSQLVAATTNGTRNGFASRNTQLLRVVIAGVAVSAAYYVGAQIGFGLTFKPHPVSTLWPPNAILFAALVLSPKRWWLVFILAVLPAHLLVEVNADVPPMMVVCWFVSNWSEALIAASLLSYLIKDEIRFDSTYQVWIFVLICFVASFVSSFIDAGFVMLNGFGTSPYWDVFRMRCFSNVLASLTLVPLVVTWKRSGIASFQNASWSRYLEAAFLAAGLSLVAFLLFATQRAGQDTIPALLYLPLPFLLWAATRFGPRGASTALLAVSFCAIWGAIHGIGPFATRSPETNALSVQLFLILAAMLILFLAALIKERERAEESVRQKEERFQLALEAAQMGTWDWRIDEDRVEWSAHTKRMFGLSPTDPELSPDEFFLLIHPDDLSRVREAVDNALATAGSYETEFRMTLKDGVVRWVRGVGKVVADDEGRVISMTGVNLDVTERELAAQKLHETSERNRAMLRALPDLVFLLSTDGVYLDYHARDENDLLLSPRAFMGKNVREVLPPDLAERIIQCLANTRLKDSPEILDYSLPMRDGERHFEARMIQTEGDKVLCIVRDTTDRQRAGEALRESQQKLRHSHSQIRDLLGRVIDVQEFERRRISRELHDDLSQKVATLSVGISRLKKKLPIPDHQLSKELDDLRDSTNRLTDDIRSLSHQLHPAVLEHLGLVTALESFIETFKDEEGIDVNLIADVGDEKIPFQSSICLYRVAVEALRNVSRHSGAATATVSLERRNNLIELQVSDGGKGFDVETARKGAGLGLVSIEERLRLLQGNCEVHSSADSGTTLVARVPLTN
ncbi:MAG TPA: MASE1 domain-containing protein [Pyrinomonadaceae bacterium]|nr:MASE1 domain-containing protein [Pyrinomonadaceae bacterium]